VEAGMVKSPIEQQLAVLQAKADTLDKIVSVAKTDGGHISDDGKNIYYILKKAGLKKSEIARVLNVTPAALSKYSA
jgi:hypothetical protein